MKRRPILRFFVDCLVAFIAIYGLLYLMGALEERARQFSAEEKRRLYAVALSDCKRQQGREVLADLERQAAAMLAPIGTPIAREQPQ